MKIQPPLALRISLALSLTLFVSTILGQSKKIPEVERYSTFETSVENQTPYADPYRDVELTVTYTNPSGETVSHYGFYDGDETWRIRFRPDFPGYWKYQASFSDGSPGLEGEFRCLWRYAPHDPLRVNQENPIWFRRGPAPFQMRALHVGDRFFADNWSAKERKDFLDWFQRQGYNTLSIASHYLNRDEPGRGQGWDTPSLWPLEATEYRKMESILDELDRRGIVVYPFAGFFGKYGLYPTDPQEQERYVKYTTARIGHYTNLLYNVAGPEPDMWKYIYFTVPEVAELGQLIQKYDIYQHPLTVHNRTNSAPHKDSDWSSFITLQGPKTIDRIKLNQGIRSLSNPGKPILAQETLWSNNSAHIKQVGKDYSDTDIRKNAYVIKMSGAEICFADNQGNSSSGFSGNLDLNLRHQLRHDILKSVWDTFETLPYYEMTPRQDLVSTGFCLANPGSNYLVYLEHDEEVNVAVAPGLYSVEWINAKHPSQRHILGTTRDGQKLAPPTGGDDWLLHLSKSGSGTPEQIHLSWSQDASSSMTATWHTRFGNNPALAEVRPLGKKKFQKHQGTTSPSPGSGWIHRVTIEGLNPDTQYEYRLSSDRGISPAFSETKSFRTAPNKDASFSFGFITDTGLPGRLDGNATGTLAIRDLLIQHDPLLVLGCGDYAYANRDARFANVGEAADRWFQEYEPLLSQVPFMSQYGNHEIFLDETFEDWSPRFAHPPSVGVGKSYSFDVGSAHFAAFFMVDKAPSDVELQWLDQDLQAARARGQKWLIVYHHEPVYAYGRSHPSKLHIAERIIPILEKNKVDLNLSSHDQNYERTLPLLGHPSAPKIQSSHRDNYVQGQGVVYCKISPSGKKSETGNRFSEFLVPQQDFMAFRRTGKHHYGIVTVEGTKALQVDVYSLEDHAKVSEMIDSFRIESTDTR